MSGLLARWLSDEYHEEIKREHENRTPFFDLVEKEQEIIIEALKDRVAFWTENEILEGNWDDRIFMRFLEKHPEWDHARLHDIIEAEMERVRRTWEN